MSRRERISPLRCSGVLLLLSLQRVASQLAHEVRRTQSPWYLIPRGGETFGCGQIAPSLAAVSRAVHLEPLVPRQGRVEVAAQPPGHDGCGLRGALADLDVEELDPTLEGSGPALAGAGQRALDALELQ